MDVVKLLCGKLTEEVLYNTGDIELATVPIWVIGLFTRSENEYKHISMKIKDKFIGAGFRLKGSTNPLVFEQVRENS